MSGPTSTIVPQIEPAGSPPRMGLRKRACEAFVALEDRLAAEAEATEQATREQLRKQTIKQLACVLGLDGVPAEELRELEGRPAVDLDGLVLGPGWEPQYYMHSGALYYHEEPDGLALLGICPRCDQQAWSTAIYRERWTERYDGEEQESESALVQIGRLLWQFVPDTRHSCADRQPDRAPRRELSVAEQLVTLIQAIAHGEEVEQ